MSRQAYYYLYRLAPWDEEYDRLIPDTMEALWAAGAKNVWLEPIYGWSNQPDVVLFVGLTEDEAEAALDELLPGKLWFSVRHVDWRRPE